MPFYFWVISKGVPDPGVPGTGMGKQRGCPQDKRKIIKKFKIKKIFFKEKKLKNFLYIKINMIFIYKFNQFAYYK